MPDAYNLQTSAVPVHAVRRSTLNDAICVLGMWVSDPCSCRCGPGRPSATVGRETCVAAAVAASQPRTPRSGMWLVLTTTRIRALRRIVSTGAGAAYYEMGVSRLRSGIRGHRAIEMGTTLCARLHCLESA